MKTPKQDSRQREVSRIHESGQSQSLDSAKSFLNNNKDAVLATYNSHTQRDQHHPLLTCKVVWADWKQQLLTVIRDFVKVLIIGLGSLFSTKAIIYIIRWELGSGWPYEVIHFFMIAFSVLITIMNWFEMKTKHISTRRRKWFTNCLKSILGKKCPRTADHDPPAGGGPKK